VTTRDSATGAAYALRDILPEETTTKDGRLVIGGRDVAELAAEYGTPVQIFDEVGMRRGIRRLIDGLAERWPNSEVLFASKSLPLVAMYALAASEGLSIDVAGEGELRLALAAGVDPARIHLHGNAKSDAEISLAVDSGVGTVIVDGPDDIRRLDRFVPEGRVQDVLIRVIPGVDAATHATMQTGGHDSKFGLLPEQAHALIEELRDHPRIHVEGVHLHIGSQILDETQFADAVRQLRQFEGLETYDVGGGLGVAYTLDDVPPTVDAYLDAIVEAAREVLPEGAKLLIEPGRSVVARAGVTAYRVSTVKETSKRFVAIDGGLADLVDIGYMDLRVSTLVAERADEEPDTTVQLVGRQCESGDVFMDDGRLHSPAIGDTVVAAATGAYSYTMTNNYNGALRPAVLFVANGVVRVAARRETYDEYLALHAPALGVDWSAAPERA